MVGEGVWCGMVWYGMVLDVVWLWYGMVMVWYGMVWYGMVMVWYGYGIVMCG